ncbi:MAG: PD40 domain-containing protein [Anaerolineales bacterium]|nr:PD40 domain-containing protein [Anaerolineales bacterium]
MIENNFFFSPRRICVVYLALIAAGCGAAHPFPSPRDPAASSTPTASRTITKRLTLASTMTLTASPIPLQDRSLSEIILQKSDLRENFIELDGRSGPECMSEVYADIPEIHTSLVHGYQRGFIRDDGGEMYSSSLFVYPDADSARFSYRALIGSFGGSGWEIPPLGSEIHARYWVEESPRKHLLNIAWRNEEAVLNLMFIGGEAPDGVEIYQLTQKIQKRLENSSAVTPGKPTKSIDNDGSIGFFAGEKAFTVSADGSGLTCVAKRSIGSLSFSPDGKKILVGPNNDAEEKKIYIINVDGSGLKALGDLRGNSPMWSPKGNVILFRNEEDNGFLYSADSQGGNLRKITDFSPNNFQWFLGGSKIGVTRWYTSSIWVMSMNEDGGGLTLVAKLQPFPYENFYNFSPDGRFLLYDSIVIGETQYHHIHIMNIDGTGKRKLNNFGDQDWFPSWSPDSSKIVFAYSYLGMVYTIRPDGSNPNRLALTEKSVSCPVWSLDGKKIAFWSHDFSTWTLFSMNADGSQKTALASIQMPLVDCPIWYYG